MMLLNIRNQVLDVVEIYQGSVSSAQVRIAEVLRPAVQRMAPALIVLHNHPSGDPLFAQEREARRYMRQAYAIHFEMNPDDALTGSHLHL